MRCTPFLLVPRRCDRFREVFGPKLALLNPFADRVVKPSNNQRKIGQKKKNIEKKRKREKTHKKIRDSDRAGREGERENNGNSCTGFLFNPSSCRGSRSSNLCRSEVYGFIVLRSRDERASAKNTRQGRSFCFLTPSLMLTICNCCAAVTG